MASSRRDRVLRLTGEHSRTQLRVSCFIMFVFGCIGIYAILAAVGPLDGPLF
jgi:hypothetical protein